jgi:signal peptidase I
MAETRSRRPYRETLEALIIAAIFLRFANTFVVQTFYIPSGSMEDTLLIGDHLFVNRYIYGPIKAWWGDSFLPARPVHRGPDDRHRQALHRAARGHDRGLGQAALHQR